MGKKKKKAYKSYLRDYMSLHLERTPFKKANKWSVTENILKVPSCIIDEIGKVIVRSIGMLNS